MARWKAKTVLKNLLAVIEEEKGVTEASTIEELVGVLKEQVYKDAMLETAPVKKAPAKKPAAGKRRVAPKPKGEGAEDIG